MTVEGSKLNLILINIEWKFELMKLIDPKIIMLILTIIMQIQAEAGEEISFADELRNIEKTEKGFFFNDETIDFYMFVSFSLSEDILRQMLDYAKLYNGIIVFRGIENNSFRETSEHIQHLAKEGEEAAIIIDPTLFKRYAVERVPSYVLVKQEKCPAGMSCNPIHDKIIGNITPKYALEKFSEKGDLFQAAKNLLRVHK